MSRTAALHLVGALALAAATVAPASTSHAWDRWHHDGGWGGGRAWQGNGGCGGCGVAGALLGLGVGAVLGAALANGEGPPPPAYYSGPPPAYAPPPGVYPPPPMAAYPPPAVYYGDDD